MHCPSCRAEFRAGIERCSECGGELLPGDLPPAGRPTVGPPLNTVAVLTSGDAGQIALARSILEAEGVPCSTSRERLQDLLGAGRMGFGYNPLVGREEIRVPEEEAERARELLAGVEVPEIGGEDDEDEDEPIAEDAPPLAPLASRRARLAFRLLVLGELALVLSHWFVDPEWQARISDGTWDALWTALPAAGWSDPLLSVMPATPLLSLVAAIGLVAFWSPARTLYVLVVGYWLLVSLGGGPSLGYGIQSFVGGVESVTTGAILALSFYGPIAQGFTRRRRAGSRPRREPASA